MQRVPVRPFAGLPAVRRESLLAAAVWLAVLAILGAVATPMILWRF